MQRIYYYFALLKVSISAIIAAMSDGTACRVFASVGNNNNETNASAHIARRVYAFALERARALVRTSTVHIVRSNRRNASALSAMKKYNTYIND